MSKALNEPLNQLATLRGRFPRHNNPLQGGVDLGDVERLLDRRVRSCGTVLASHMPDGKFTDVPVSD